MSNNNFGYSFYLSASGEKFCIKSLTKNAIHYGYSDDILNHKTFALPFPASATRVFIFDDMARNLPGFMRWMTDLRK
jgi:hypothetical protein